MNAEVLCIGTEILLGDIVNTNGAYLARAGNTRHRRLPPVGGGRQQPAAAGQLKACAQPGGYRHHHGRPWPHHDVVTKKAVADYFGLNMEPHEPSVRKIKAFYQWRDVPMTPNNLLQAQVPAGATVFFNDAGFAPGFAVEQGGKTVIMLPGPPNELYPMFEKQVAPFLEKYTGARYAPHLHIFGMGESLVEETLHDLMTASVNHHRPTPSREVQCVSAKAKPRTRPMPSRPMVGVSGTC